MECSPFHRKKARATIFLEIVARSFCSKFSRKTQLSPWLISWENEMHSILLSDRRYKMAFVVVIFSENARWYDVCNKEIRDFPFGDKECEITMKTFENSCLIDHFLWFNWFLISLLITLCYDSDLEACSTFARYVYVIAYLSFRNPRFPCALLKLELTESALSKLIASFSNHRWVPLNPNKQHQVKIHWFWEISI